MNISKKKERVNVGCLPMVTDPALIDKILMEHPHEILTPNLSTGKLEFLSSPSSSPSPSPSPSKPPPSKDLNHNLADTILDSCYAIGDALQEVFVKVGSVATEVMDNLGDAISQLTNDALKNINGLLDESWKSPQETSGSPSPPPPSTVKKEDENFEFHSDVELITPSCPKHPTSTDWIALEKEPTNHEINASNSLEGSDSSSLSDAPQHHNKTPGRTLLMFITSRSHPEFFILPKGGLHKKEAPCCGALRESWEEAGVAGACEQEITIIKDDDNDDDKDKDKKKEKETVALLDTGLPDEDSKKRKIKKWFWFVLKINQVFDAWPERAERQRGFVLLENVDKITNIRQDARLILDSWLTNHATNCSKN